MDKPHWLLLKWKVWNYLMDWSFSVHWSAPNVTVRFFVQCPQFICNLFDCSENEVEILDTWDHVSRLMEERC